jgi:rod shape-determining protein MreC
MRPERYAYSYASSGSSRSLKSRILLVVLVLLALVLLVMARAHAPFVTKLRMQLDGAVTPLMRLINTPVRGAEAVVANKKSLFNAYEENKQLKEENDTLRHWQAVAQALKVENDNLRKLADYKPSRL